MNTPPQKPGPAGRMTGWQRVVVTLHLLLSGGLGAVLLAAALATKTPPWAG